MPSYNHKHSVSACICELRLYCFQDRSARQNTEKFVTNNFNIEIQQLLNIIWNSKRKIQDSLSPLLIH